MRHLIATILVFCFILCFASMGETAIADGLLLCLPFDDDKGGTTKDLSGNKFDGELQGGAKLDDGKVNKSIRFNGSDAFIAVPPLEVDPGTFTIEFWFSPNKDLDAGGARMDLMYAHTGCCRPHITFNRQSDGGIGLHAEFGGNGDQGPISDLATATGKWKSGEWYHWAGTADKTETKVYVNGKFEKKLKSVGVPNLRYEEHGISIGSAQGASNWFSGRMDEIRIWERVLTDAEIRKAFDLTLLSVDAKGKLAITWAHIKSQ